MTTRDTGRAHEPGRVVPRQRRRRRPLHAADLRIEAWAPTMHACFAGAVGALAESILGPGRPPVSATVRFDVRGDNPSALLDAVLRRVISFLPRHNAIATRAEVVRTETGLRVRCELVDAGAVVLPGPIPKGVSRGSVLCERTDLGWWCAAGIDV
ncbi:archease [Prauserella flavalba]|uniref:archease n=1 Tax=Prauserella flavalba TaxID=1477506 RepID=UPI0036E689F3